MIQCALKKRTIAMVGGPFEEGEIVSLSVDCETRKLE